MRTVLPILALAGLCGAAELKTGAPAPVLALSQTLQAPAGTAFSWDALRGNVVVLEFWATWCAGCRDRIPHLNKLEQQFRNKAVRFISITDEEPGVVQRFLKDYPISGWVGLDLNGRTFTRYGVSGRPTTALVDATGTFRGIGDPREVDAETIEDLLAGRPIVFPALREGLPAAKVQSLPDPLYQVMIRSAGPVQVTGNSPGAVTGKAGKSWEAWGVSLTRLLADTYDVPEERISAPEWGTRAKRVLFDIALAAPDLTNERRLALMQRGLEEAFQLKVHKEARDTGVYVLRRRLETEPKLTPAAAGGSSHWNRGGNMTAVAVPLAALTDALGQVVGKTVVDETGLTGRFDFELKWDTANAQSLVEAVRTQLALDLAPARRPLQYLVVDAAVQPQAW
jgi:uncharacterized protein (TIGR03435 family)